VPYWTQEQWSILDGTWVGERLRFYNEELAQNHAILSSIAPELFSEHSLDDFVRAHLVFMSRAYELENDQGFALIPLADLFNHRLPNDFQQKNTS
jgi:hypothetical protein